MTVRVSSGIRPWGRACIVAVHTWLVVSAGIEVASASGAGRERTEDACTPAAADAVPGVTGSTSRSKDEAGGAERANPRATVAPRAIASPIARAAQTSRFAQASPDFLFGQPRFSVAFHGLQLRPRATGDFHTFVHETLFAPTSPQDDPLDPMAGRMNFDATGLGFDVGFGIGSRLEARVGADYALVRAQTEDRYNLDEFGLPIEQNTELAQWGIHGDVAFALTPRGRAIGQYVWIPSAVVPYVGAGAAFVRYRTALSGRFVDVIDLTIFSDTIQSQGWAPSVHAFGGVDFRMTQHVLLTTEARYSWATAELDGVLAGFDHDLTGLRISAGVRFVF